MSRYDPCTDEPSTLGELITWLCQRDAFNRPRPPNAPPNRVEMPVIPKSAAFEAITVHCIAKRGGFTLQAVGDNIRAEYCEAKGLTVAEADTVPLNDVVSFVRCKAEQQRKRRRVSERKQTPLTPNQLEAMHLVAENKGNITEAAKKTGRSRQAMAKLYEKGNAKLAKLGVEYMPKEERLPEDDRGQVIVPRTDRRRRLKKRRSDD